MCYLVWRKGVDVWLATAILTVVYHVTQCANNTSATPPPPPSSSYVSFPNEPACHILLAGEALLLRCQFDQDCERWWCHQEPGTTAYLMLPDGDFFGTSIFTRKYVLAEGSSSSPGSRWTRNESVLLVEQTSVLYAGQYLCVCAATNLTYKIDIAIVNVSAKVQPKCNRRVELTFDGMVQPIPLSIYKWICRPYEAQLVSVTTMRNFKRFEIELDIAADSSSKVSCYFYIKSPNDTCGVRVVSVAFEIHTKEDMCNIDLLQVSTADSVRHAILVMTFLLIFLVISHRSILGDAVATSLI